MLIDTVEFMTEFGSKINTVTRSRFYWRALILLLALACIGTARAAGYTASITTAYPQLAIPSSATMVKWYGAGGNSCGTNNVSNADAFRLCDDGVSPVMPIGFAFTFGGVAYNNWSMSSNGVIFFETGAVGTASTGGPAWTPNNLPTSTFGAGKPALMPFWADLWKSASANNVLDADAGSQPASASFIQYQTLSVGSAQVLVIQLKKVGFFNAAGTLVNMQIQLWSTGQIVYSYGNINVMTSNPLLRIGLQYAGGGCYTLANNQSASLSSQSYLFEWRSDAATCGAQPVVNHFEIRHDGAATLCAEPVEVLACAASTAPCPAADVIQTQIINLAVTASGSGSLATPSVSPPSVNLQPASPRQKINLTWAAGSAGTATLGIQSAIRPTNALRCANVAGTSVYANCNIAVSSTACIAPPNHFEVVGPGNGNTCSNHTFTIRAWADAARSIPYMTGWSGTLSQSGNPAALPNLGAFTIPNGSSSVDIAPISFPATGTTTFGAIGTPAVASVSRCNFGGSSSCALPVVSCGPVALNATDSGANAVSGRIATKVAATPFNLDIHALNAAKSAADTSPAGGVLVELLANSTTGVGLDANNCPTTGTALSVGTVTLVSGKASANVPAVARAWRDVRVRMRYPATGTASLTACSTDNFAIRPGALTVPGSSVSPAAPSPTGTPTLMAGNAFTVSASTATHATDGYGATLVLDTTKLSAQDPTDVTAIKSGGTIGSLTIAPVLKVNESPATGQAKYTEVGYLNLAPGALRDDTFTVVDQGASGDCIAFDPANPGSTNWLSATAVGGKYGCSIGNQATITFGRFTPSAFKTEVTNACGSFTYSGQPFSLTVTARNAAGDTTRNYASKFAKAITLSDANAATGSWTNGSLTASAFADGVASRTDAFTFTDKKTAERTLLLRAVDTDGVSSASGTEGSTPLRSGRLRLFDTYGSVSPLRMPVETQYWSGNSWVKNTGDSCTTAAGSTVAFAASPASGWLLTPEVFSGGRMGSGGLKLEKASAGEATISATVPTWLKPDATAKAKLGSFGNKESRKAVHIRETY